VRRLFWILFAILTAALFVVIATNGGAIEGLSRIDVSSQALQIALIAIGAAFVLAFVRQRFSRAIEGALTWVVIVALLAIGYTYRFELRDVAERVIAELMPGSAAGRGRVVEIARGGNGNFSLMAQLNGAHINMVLDTGASSVVLTHDAAKAAGLPLEVLAYTVTVDTANGRTRAAPVTLDSVSIGGIVERAVPALIAQRGQLRSNLLGMTFLNRLERWEVRGDKLVLRGYP